MAPPNINQVLIDHFRLPDSLARFELGGPLEPEDGYFRCGPDLTCFGQTVSGQVSSSADGPLHDEWHDDAALKLTFDPSEVVKALRTERYLDRSDANPARHLLRAAINSAYYLVRPVLSVSVRKHLQRRVLRGWDRITFPKWPVDTTVETLLERLLARLIESRDGEPVPFVWFWPEGHAACTIMTHDVESVSGRDFCSRMMDIEERYGFKSSFQMVPEGRYPVDKALFKEIAARGFELNLHGLNHDGHLFRNHEEFLRRAEAINGYVEAFGARGFRSPVMYRNAEWIGALKVDYDMSFPNVAHLDPQRGGCCTVMPYFIDHLVELPLTAIQDYSLFNILNDFSIKLWKEQSEAVLGKHGLISFIVHPDYVKDEKPWRVYEDLLAYLADWTSDRNVWRTLPGDAAAWWRQRSAMEIVEANGGYAVRGTGHERARVALATLEDGRVVYSFPA